MTNVVKFSRKRVEKTGPYFAGRPLHERFPNLRPKPRLAAGGPSTAEVAYVQALVHIHACSEIICGLADPEFYALFDHSIESVKGGNGSLNKLILQDMLAYERSARGGRGE